MKELWITGFEAFTNPHTGDRIDPNPASVIATYFDGRQIDEATVIRSFVLEVSHDGIQEFMNCLDRHVIPRGIICFGLGNAHAPRPHVELCARSASDRNLIIPTRIDLRHQQAIDHLAVWSVDAGDYFCNDLYFACLTHPSSVPCVFVHVPCLKARRDELATVYEPLVHALAQMLMGQ